MLSEITAWCMARLAIEAGTNLWWTNAQIDSYVNEVYRDSAMALANLKHRDATTNTVVGTARYVIPLAAIVDHIIKLTNVQYDPTENGYIDFYTNEQLDDTDPLWRSLGNGTPWGAFYELGDENLAVSLVPAPGDIKPLAFEFVYVPAELGQSDSPKAPYNGVILANGAMAMALAAPGGGRDLDRSDYYFALFMSQFPTLSKHLSPVWRGLRSVEDAPYKGGVRLPSNYPRYSFD